MIVIVKTVRLSKQAENQLNQLKRKTKIKQWNILCRWALCRSLAEESIPSPVPINAEAKPPSRRKTTICANALHSNVEISWSVFGGEIADILAIAIKQRCHKDGLGTEPEILKEQFDLHLHRGIGYLAGDPNIKNIEDLVSAKT